jgi:hypothetical protein
MELLQSPMNRVGGIPLAPRQLLTQERPATFCAMTLVPPLARLFSLMASLHIFNRLVGRSVFVGASDQPIHWTDDQDRLPCGSQKGKVEG